jgi:flagellar L-ring protein precursor FlgH
MPAPARILVAAAAAAALAGCAGPQPIDDWTATMPPNPPVIEPVEANGAIFHPATAVSLFADVKARRVGDTLTIRLVEQTNATTTASTNTTRDSNTSITNPTLFGEELTRGGGLPLFQNSLDSISEFEGEGDSSQSNSMQGNISVTVYQRLPNGNLVVRGEKWIKINRGRELLRVAGIVRPADIAEDNSVPSFKLADARLEYTARGAIGDANRPGWLTRFFQSPIFPF